MDRLTERIEKYIEAYQSAPFGREVEGTVELLQEVSNKLAEYERLEEQLGIPLKQLSKLCDKHIQKDCQNPNKAIVLTDEDVDRWNEYKNAEEQGLLLRLPCNVGDTVYVLAECNNINLVLDGTMYDSSGGYGTATGYYCPYELNEKCPHDDFDCCESENKTAVFEDTVTCIDYEETGITLQCLHTNVCGNIGEYIFLTREEAEQKLKESD